MSTIKSSTEHLTLNADGAGKEIKFQANGVDVAGINATGFTGDGSQLTGAGASSLNELSDATVSTVDPAIDTNPSATGAVWINKTSGEVYVCTDITAGANIWTNVGDGSIAVVPPFYFGSTGVFMGGSLGDTIDYVNLSSAADATDFGNLSSAVTGGGALSGGWKAIHAGGYGGGTLNIIEYVTISTKSDAIDFGDLTVARNNLAACSNGERGLMSGGVSADTIDYITVATPSNATDFGNMVVSHQQHASFASTTRGVFAGGNSGGSVTNSIEYVTIATTSNATDFGDIAFARERVAGCSSLTRGLIAGGYINYSPYTRYNNIEYVTIATTGNSTDFGDISTGSLIDFGSCSDGIKGFFVGGSSTSSGTTINNIQYVTIATTGNSTDFGDLTVARQNAASCSGN